MEARLDRIEQHIQALVGVTSELSREVREFLLGLAEDRALFQKTLRELRDFARQVQRADRTDELS